MEFDCGSAPLMDEVDGAMGLVLGDMRRRTRPIVVHERFPGYYDRPPNQPLMTVEELIEKARKDENYLS